MRDEPMPVDVFSVSHQPSGRRSAVTMRRLRATLRLLFDERTADDVAVAAGTGTLDEDALRAVASRARSQYLMERVLRRLPGHRRVADEDRPLPASLGVSGDAAVALAFHIGLGLGAGTIAEMLERAPEQVGADLFKARQAIDLSLPVPCERFTSTVSILNDRALDADERLQYVSHLQGCERCPVVVDAMATLDAELRAEVALQERGIGDAPPRARRSRRLLPAAGVALVAIAVIAGLLALSGLLSGGGEPVPLVAAGGIPEPHDGWVIQQSMTGQLEVLNLATKETRALVASTPTGNVTRWPVFSPGFDKIAGWIQTMAGTTIIEVTDLDGNALHSVSLDHSEAYWYFIGWHGHDELLLATTPMGPGNETQDAFYERAATTSRLLAVDVATGDERVLFQGNVASAFIAPDGTRVIIVRPYDPRWPGGSIELREMGDNGVGDLIATVERRVAGVTGMWAADSSAFYFSHIADEELEFLELGPNQFPPSNALRYEQAELAALGRDGELSTLWQAEPETEIVVASVSPDSETVIFRSGNRQTSGYFRYIFWRIPASGGEAETFIESPHPDGVWSPDGETLLWPTAVSWYLAEEATDAMGRSIPDIALVAHGPDWEPRTIYGALGSDPVGARVLVWLPDDALPIEVTDTPVEIQGQAAEPAPVMNAGTGNRLVSGSSPSPNGQYVTLETSTEQITIWNTERRQARVLLGGSEGGTWLPNGDGLLDTARPRGDGAATRLMFYAPQFTRDTDARYDFRQLNPAGLAESGAPYYAAPHLSPDQFNASFYVVNPEQRSVALWVGGWDTAPREVLRWQVQAGRLLDLPLTAVWADERTLLISQPADWRDGLPRKVILTRITVDGDDVSAEPLVEIDVRQREVGVILWEMELSPDGEQIAYRLRRYGELSAEGGRTDTLHVVDVTDIGSPFELARGAPGDGIAWSKDSRWLVAGTRGRIALMSVDGRELSYISPDGARADHPLWITTHEVWFSLDTGNGPEIWRVRVD